MIKSIIQPTEVQEGNNFEEQWRERVRMTTGSQVRSRAGNLLVPLT